MSVQLPESTPDVERLTSLLFELASQLHVERAQRIALELVLEESGALPADWKAQFEAGAGAGDGVGESYHSRCQEALDDAMDRLMQIMAESRDPRTPLRHEAAGFRDSQEG